MRALTRLRRLVRPARFRARAPDIVELYASAPIGAALLSPRGRFLKTNLALQRFLGYGPDELSEMDLDSATLRPDLPRCRELLDRLRRGELDHFDVEKRYVRKDGEIVWAHSLVTAAPGVEGRRAFALLLDITQRKRAEERLERSAEDFKSLYSRTPAMMHSIDREGRLLAVSDRWLETLGYERREVLGRRSVEFLTPESRRYAEREVLPEYFRTGSCTDIPYTLVRKDGSEVEVLLSATCECDASGRPVRSLAVLVDVTARNRAERELARLRESLEESIRERTAELARSNSDLETYAYAASHDLSAPVRKISAYADLLRRSAGAKLDERESRMLEVVARSASRMSSLIDDMLTLRRVGGLELPLQPVDLDEVVGHVLSDLELVISDARAAVTTGPLGRALGNQNNLRRLFQNLVSNAVKFRRPGVAPVVRVEAEEAGGWVKVSVTDNGIGFEQRFADKIFRPFLRLHPVGEYPGSGVGLAICRRIAQSCGGAVEAVGRPGQGSTFTVRLRRP